MVYVPPAMSSETVCRVLRGWRGRSLTGQTLQIVLVGMLDHGHDQVARGQRCGHAQMNGFVNVDVVSIHTGIHTREVTNGFDDRFCDKRVNVNFSPNFSWKAPLLALRHMTKLVTSASTNDVTCGLVWTLRTMWSAIIFRMRSISTMS